MMKLLLVSALVALAAADVSHLFKGNNKYNPQYYQQYQRPVEQHHPAKDYGIVRSDSVINPDGSFDNGYETDNGIVVQQHGQQNVYGQEIQGSYQYRSPEGVPVAVSYIADQNGYQPSSDLLPTPPPVPALILRSLEYNAAHPEPQVKQPFVGRF